MPLAHPIQWLRDHPRAADALLAGLVAFFLLGAHLGGESSVDDPDQPATAWWTVLLVLAQAVPLAWRRVHPLAVGLLVVAAEVTALFLGLAGAAFVAAAIAVYSIGAHTSGVRRTRTMAAIAALVVGLFVAGWIDGFDLLAQFVSTSILLVTAFVLGDNLRRRRDNLAGLAERAERAERERELLAEQRVVAERTRIARELHDVVAHSVSVMVIQAAAARRNLDSAPDTAAEALANIESTGRQTMTELRNVLGVLRTDDPSAPGRNPQPSIDDVAGLIHADELPVSARIGTDLTDVPDGASITAYRLVQEALTNVRRHAGPVSEVALTIERCDGLLRVEVVDDGRGAAADHVPGGFGLVGMHERVAAVGGTLSAGPRPGGGWRVLATIPIGDRPTTAPPAATSSPGGTT
jgi:signal transduction histidine kinase